MSDGPEATGGGTEGLRALCAEFGWDYEHSRMLKDGPWKMARPVIEGGWIGWVYLAGEGARQQRFSGPREAIEWCDAITPTPQETDKGVQQKGIDHE